MPTYCVPGTVVFGAGGKKAGMVPNDGAAAIGGIGIGAGGADDGVDGIGVVAGGADDGVDVDCCGGVDAET